MRHQSLTATRFSTQRFCLSVLPVVPEVVELVFELEVDSDLYVGLRSSGPHVVELIHEDRLVNSTISGENVVPPMLGKEHLDGERLVDARSFKRDVGERRIMGLCSDEGVQAR